MNYEKAYKELRLEIIPVLNGYKIYLENNTHFEFLKIYTDTMAQVETLEKLEKIIIHNEEHLV